MVAGVGHVFHRGEYWLLIYESCGHDQYFGRTADGPYDLADVEAETSQEHSVSGGNRLGCRKGLVFGIGLAGLEAVVEAAEEAIEQVALCGGVPITDHAAAVLMGSRTH